MKKFFNTMMLFAALSFAAALYSCEEVPEEPIGPGTETPGEGDIGNVQGLIWTSPSFVSEDTTSDVTIFVNAKGTSFEGKSVDMYAHTGVITNLSTGSGDWKYVKHGWSVNADDCKLTKGKNDVWSFTMTGGPRAFYGVPEGETIQKLAFVFRSADGKMEIKDEGADIFVELSKAGTDVKFESPSNNTIVEYGSTIAIKVVAKDAEWVSLSLGETELKRVENELSLEYDYEANAYEDLVFVARAGMGSNFVEATLNASVLGATQDAPRPAGIKDGVTVNGTEATFVLYAPGKKRVCVIGDFNNYSATNEHMMKRDGDYFWVTASGLEPNTEYGYQFLVDDEIRIGDPYGTKVLTPYDKYINPNINPGLKEYPTGLTTEFVTTFSTAPKQDFAWAPFTRPDVEDLVVYELLLRDFTADPQNDMKIGTLEGAMAELDYLEELGINAIELLPIMEFDGNNSWGYDPCYYFAPDKVYGDANAYKTFIDECHKRGIAVILDIVLNHSTGLCPWAKMWWDGGGVASNNPFYNRVARHPYNVHQDFNHEYAKTRSFFKDVIQYWVEEFNIDGYRFDLSKGLTQTNSGSDVGKWGQYDQSRVNILKDYQSALREVDNSAYMILEHLGDYSEEKVLADAGMILWRNMNHSYRAATVGSNGDFSGSYANPVNGFISYMESHDEERIAYGAIGATSDTSTVKWGVVGTINNWTAPDIALNKDGDFYVAKGVTFDLSDNTASNPERIKIRGNGEWDDNYNYGAGTDNFTLTVGQAYKMTLGSSSKDMRIPASGTYDIYFNLASATVWLMKEGEKPQISGDAEDALTVAMRRAGASAAFLLAVPGPKMIWQFGEIGYDYSINYNDRTGQKPVVTDSYMAVPARKALYDTYSDILNFRADHSYFFDQGTTVGFWASSAQHPGKYLYVTSGSKRFALVGNFGGNTETIWADAPDDGSETWYNYFDSSETYKADVLQIPLKAGEFKLLVNFRP